MDRALVLVLAACLGGCGGGSGNDAGVGNDSGTGETDSGSAPIDGGGDDAGMLDMDAGTAVDGGTSDAGSDAGPPPLFEDVDDGTVVLAHDIPSCAPAFGIDSAGNTFILHSTVEDGVRAARLDGRTWTSLGQVNDASHSSLNINICPALVVATTGTVYAAYVANNASERFVRVKRLEGSSWVDVLAIDRPIADFAPALGLDMTIDSSDRPVLALVEFVGTNYRFTARRLEGDSFVPFGTGTIDATAAAVRVTTRPDGTVVMLGMHQVGFGRILDVYTSDGGDWSELPDIASVPDSTRTLNPDDVEADDTTIWASYWDSNTAGAHAQLARSNGSGWDYLEQGPDESRYPNIALIGGTTLVQGFSFAPGCSARRHDGSKLGETTELPIPCDTLRVRAHHGSVYVGYRFPSQARLGRLNLP